MMGGGILIWLLLAGILVVAVGGVDRLKELLQQGGGISSGNSMRERESERTPDDILRERYARGELTREEYLEAQETLNM